MNFPSDEFHDGLAAWSQGTITPEQCEQLEALLADNAAARDEYLWQVELHARLCSARVLLIDPAPGTELAIVANPSDESRSRRPILYPSWAMTATLICIAAYLVSWLFAVRHEDLEPTTQNGSRSEDQAGVNRVEGEPSETSSSRRIASMAGLIHSNVRFAWSRNGTVIVGTGPADPLPLGAFVPYDTPCPTLHVWDWSKGKMSKVFLQSRLLEEQRFALSPDGKSLAQSNGKITDLNTGKISQIELGPEFFRNQGDHLRRIQDLEFSPDGGRLALLTTKIEIGDSSHQLLQHDLKFSPEILILNFLDGRLLSRFPAGHGSATRFAFSARGDRIFSAAPADELKQQIIERETDTGKIVRTYDPGIEKHAYALGVSPSGARLAVFDGAGALLLWDTITGKRLHRVESVRAESPATALRFSQDSRLLAVNAVTRSFVVDVETGNLLATLHQTNAAHFLWSDDGERLTIVTGYAHYEGGAASLYNHSPAVFEWNWREGKLLQSHESAPPERKEGPSSSLP